MKKNELLIETQKEESFVEWRDRMLAPYREAHLKARARFNEVRERHNNAIDHWTRYSGNAMADARLKEIQQEYELADAEDRQAFREMKERFDRLTLGEYFKAKRERKNA